MYLNEEAQEMMIDFLLEQDRSSYLDLIYPGYEGIVITLVKDGTVTFPQKSGDDIESFLCDFDFVICSGYDVVGIDTTTLKIDIEKVADNTMFKKYAHEMKIDVKREIRQLEKDAEELRAKLGRMNTLVAV